MAEALKFPSTLEEFGYKFNKDGKLVSIDSNVPFAFEVKKGCQDYNQKHYEALGEVVTSHIYNLLESECSVHRLPVPHDAKEESPQSFVFISQNALEMDNLLVLIHGSGVVRAGQWARSLIINDNINSGTQIPFIKRGIQEGYGVLVMNTNDNCAVVNGNKRKIKSSEDPYCHGFHVWKHYIHKSKAKNIAIVAHSYGGVVTTKLYTKFKKEFHQKVFAVAMTDSVHYLMKPEDYKGLVNVSRNWRCSAQPLDTPITNNRNDVPGVSAGCLKHEMTSWSSFNSIFIFLMEKLQTRLNVADISLLDGQEPMSQDFGGEGSDDGVAGPSSSPPPPEEPMEKDPDKDSVDTKSGASSDASMTYSTPSEYDTSGDEGVEMEGGNGA